MIQRQTALGLLAGGLIGTAGSFFVLTSAHAQGGDSKEVATQEPPDVRVVANDGGVYVLRGNQLVKYDQDLTLRYAVSLPPINYRFPSGRGGDE